MSKKIIYLLSLLMALSLVFASCKKNNSTAPNTGDGPGELPDVGPSDKVDQTTGLYNNYDDILTDSAANENGFLQSSPGILKYQASAKPDAVGDFLRNPVITVLDGNNVLIVYEYRYENPGSENDIGVDGSTVVDIAYILSTDSGKSFHSTVNQQFVGEKAGSDPAKAKGAPVVFKLDDKTVAVVASGGAALSRVNKLYGIGEATRQRQQESSLWYIVGELAGSTISWGEWKQIDDKQLKDKISSVNGSGLNVYSKSGVTFAQYATHSGKGVVTGNTLLLPVVIADQGAYDSNLGGAKEYMGFVLVKGTWNSGKEITWKAQNDDKNSIIWSEGVDAGTAYKEARLLAATSENDYNYFVVPKLSGKVATGKSTASTVAQPNVLTDGYDGSAGFVQIPKWYGTQQYNPATYTSEGNAKSKNLLTHVSGYESNLKMYVLSDDFTKVEGNGYAIKGHEKSKSSSIDVLADGTIVMVAEGGFVKSGVNRSYYINFIRFPQHLIANQTGNNQ